MTKFRRYDSLARLGHGPAEGIEIGTVHVFPKLDGTNASAWWNSIENLPMGGSRNRELSLENDNAGFYNWLRSEAGDNLAVFLEENPNLIVYGEWMVPHTLKTYREEVWHKFWVFDVYDRVAHRYLPYERYEEMLRPFHPHIIEPLCTIWNPSQDQLKAQVEVNTYLIAQGAGLGEGVVLKNYAWYKYQAAWAKVVRNEFKEDNARAFGVPKKTGEFQVEFAIAEEFVTPHLVGKTRAKVLLEVANEQGEDITEPNWQQKVESTYRGKVIPQLLGRVYHDLVVEEIWSILKKHKGATINFKTLLGHVTLQTKKLAADLF